MARNTRLRLAHGVLSRVLACTVALSFAGAPLQLRAAAPDQEIERLYVEGQDKYAAGDFAGAADAWTRLLERLPEAQSNRATRENVLLNVVQAHLDGYARTRKDDGSKDIEMLRAGKQVLDTYFAGFKKAYGDRAAVSTAVQEKADELERALADAEREAAVVPDPGPGPDAGGGGTGSQTSGDSGGGGNQRDVIVLESGNDGSGLIAGGAVAAGLSLGGFGVLAAGALIAKRAEDDFLAVTCESPCTEDQEAAAQSERDDAETRGRTGNALTITGAIVGPVLLITGGVLIGLGIKRRADAKAARDEQIRKSIGVVPTASRNFAGLVISGRF
jgi:hypothetical protein